MRMLLTLSLILQYRAMSEEATRKYGQNMGEIVAEVSKTES